MINFRPIAKVVGTLSVLIGLMMLLCIPVSLYYDSGDAGAFLQSALIITFIGIIIRQIKTGDEATKLNKREGYLIVALSWLFMGLYGALPYYISGFVANPVDAIFESFSGLTTTGASILNDIEYLPNGLLFWRSLTQWIGGMGIIVLSVALLPLLGIGGVELFTAEAPGPTADKIHPRIKETAKKLWLIYLTLTIVLSIILFIEGMTGFDAINHALTTMATGGFSTKNTSIAYYNDIPIIQYTLSLFMFIAGMNYFMIYSAYKRRFTKVWNNEEFKMYFAIVAGLAFATGLGIYFHSDQSIEKSFRDGLFQVVSLITTTGYVSADYTQWGNGLLMIFFGLLFVGASAGSTSGGIKIIRHLVFLKNSTLEFKRLLHPRAMIRIKINKELVAPRILTHILVFLLVYLLCITLGTVLLCFLEIDFMTALGAVATSLGNVGPGIGDVGPVDNFSHFSDGIKLILSFIMLVGRLELFTILILFTPYFWKVN